jgi:hypothetical protein
LTFGALAGYAIDATDYAICVGDINRSVENCRRAMMSREVVGTVKGHIALVMGLVRTPNVGGINGASCEAVRQD